jgi:hypothetical protein
MEEDDVSVSTTSDYVSESEEMGQPEPTCSSTTQDLPMDATTEEVFPLESNLEAPRDRKNSSEEIVCIGRAGENSVEEETTEPEEIQPPPSDNIDIIKASQLEPYMDILDTQHVLTHGKPGDLGNPGYGL